MNPDIKKLVLCAGAFAVLAFLVIRGLVTKRLRSRYGFTLTAMDRPASFYATIVLYSLVACACLLQAIRSAHNLLGG